MQLDLQQYFMLCAHSPVEGFAMIPFALHSRDRAMRIGVVFGAGGSCTSVFGGDSR